jgi:hypothetical protein
MWAAIKLYWSKIWTYIKPAVMVLLTEVGKRALAIALDVCTQLATSDLSSSEKRDAAFKQIGDKLAEEGHTAASSLINLAIELAVQKLKAAAS